MEVYKVEKIIISNVSEIGRKWDSNLEWGVFQSGPNSKQKHPPEFLRSTVCTPFSTGSKLEVYFYTILLGKSSCPYHYHTANEEIFYITSGHGILRTPEGDKAVSEGDVIVMPANENGAHKLTNTSDVPLIYLEVKTATTPEVCVQPDSEKAVIIAPPKFFAKTYKIDSDVNYLDGEDYP